MVAQHQLTGKIIDSKSKEPLAFVNIITVNHNHGTTTGIDGRFTINSNHPINMLKLSYVGYEPAEVIVTGEKNIAISLNRTSYEIAEFKVLPGINPAERIIKEVVKNRKKHNPEKSLNFKYDSYNKTYFTVAFDSILISDPSKIEETDSSMQATLDWFDKHHIFMMESVTQRKYKQPDKNYEKVIGSRVSGFSNPSFSLIGTDLQSLSFYDPLLIVMDKSYLNPISQNSINKYLFLIEDTTYNEKDTVYIISFRPRKGKNFDALKGLLYVNTGGFALQNVIAEPVIQDEGLIIKIQQQYKKIEGSWFPVQLNSTLVFINDQIEEIKMLAVSKSYLKNIEINPELNKKEFSYIDTEIDIDAGKRSEEFWNKYREDSLSTREQNTYHLIDSVGKAENFDRKLKGLEALITGKLMWGPISLDLNRFMGYNAYEGFRLGAGLHTNERVLKWATIGGYGAYAFKDKEFKYGGDVEFKIKPQHDISLQFSMIKDVEEPGVIGYKDYKPPLISTAGYRLLYLSRMNRMDKIEGRFKFRTFRYLKVYAFANQENIEVTNDYYFKKRIAASTVLNDQYYTFSNLGVEFRYAFKEKVKKALGNTFAKPTKYPIIYAKIEQGTPWLNGEYQYTRYSLRAEKSFHIKNIGKPTFYIETGLTSGRVPQHKLNTPVGTFLPSTLSMFKNGNGIRIITENVFETMAPYEFFSSEYVHFHFKHNFGSLLFRIKKWRPDLIITSSAGIGSLSYQGSHAGVAFKTMEKGYYESGIILANIFKIRTSSFGIGSFFRYGPYRLEKESDNFVLKGQLGFTF